MFLHLWKDWHKISHSRSTFQVKAIDISSESSRSFYVNELLICIYIYKFTGQLNFLHHSLSWVIKSTVVNFFQTLIVVDQVKFNRAKVRFWLFLFLNKWFQYKQPQLLRMRHNLIMSMYTYKFYFSLFLKSKFVSVQIHEIDLTQL